MNGKYNNINILLDIYNTVAIMGLIFMEFFDNPIPKTQDPRPAELRAGKSKLGKPHLVSVDGGKITTHLKPVVSLCRHRKERCRDTLPRQVGKGTEKSLK